jgi:L-ascorbate metabolism protein UlaG (beta-lactamase superfamily)
MDERLKAVVNKISWLGHASFRIAGSKTIYIDPWKLPDGIGGDGDIVLITHDHYDHCSPEDIKKALAPTGELVVAECCRPMIPKADKYVLPYMNINVKGIEIYITAAYNINKKFHLREYGHVGFIFTVDGVTIYITGDTDAFPHMRDLTCDIVILPVSGTYVMTPAEAVDACNLLSPSVAIPMHWGDPDVVGTIADAERFSKISPCETVILEQVR